MDVILLLEAGQDLRPVRQKLRAAMQAAQLLPCWREWQLGKGPAPFRLKKNQVYPAVYIVGREAWNGREPALSVDEWKTILSQAPPRRRVTALQHHLSFLAAVGVAFFPKCPFCWAAYMSLLGAVGLEGISYQPWLLPVLIGMLFLNLWLFYQRRQHHGLWPFACSLVGGLLVTLNRLYLEWTPLMIAGAALLVVAALWNSLPPRLSRSIGLYFRANLFNQQRQKTMIK